MSGAQRGTAVHLSHAGLNKSYGAKKVLENIHLSFYPDAKIGILGPNGAGKSTVLRIMAGLDKEFTGEAWLAEGATLGYLPQEPQLDESLNVLGNVMEGVAEKQAILDRYNELMMNYSDETADEGAKLQDIIDAPEPVGPRQPGRDGDGSAALPAAEASVDAICPAARSAASRCASCCFASPTCCCSTSRPTTSTPKASPGWKSTCANIPAP
jgi:energy-coupling factor transporter ATP-binding protein EcfA2